MFDISTHEVGTNRPDGVLGAMASYHAKKDLRTPLSSGEAAASPRHNQTELGDPTVWARHDQTELSGQRSYRRYS